MTDIFLPLITLHQQVRDFVEAQYPDYKVTRIDASATTKYMPQWTKSEPATKQEIIELLLYPVTNVQPDSDLVLQEVQVTFRVEAVNRQTELHCEVEVAERTGKLGEEELVILRRPQIRM